MQKWFGLQNGDIFIQVLLTIGTITKDLYAKGPIERCLALSAIDSLVEEEYLPAVMPMVIRLLAANEDIVRQRACMTMHHIARRYPNIEIDDVPSHLARLIGDRSPSVLSAALCWLVTLLERQQSPIRATSLASSLVAVFHQCLQYKVIQNLHFLYSHRTEILLLQKVATGIQ